MPATAKFLEWREMRDGREGTTPYSGYLIELDNGQRILIGKLSHGPRPLAYKGALALVLKHEGEPFEISDQFLQQVLDAYAADQLFQKQFADFETATE
jgi:hypothetical protein